MTDRQSTNNAGNTRSLDGRHSTGASGGRHGSVSYDATRRSSRQTSGQRSQAARDRLQRAAVATRQDMDAHYADRPARDASAYRRSRREGDSADSVRSRSSRQRARRTTQRMPEPAPKRRGKFLPALLVVLLVVVLALVVLVFKPFGIGAGLFSDNGAEQQDNAIVDANSAAVADGTEDDALPTPIMAESSGVYLHSAVAMDDLTEVLIHNASYDYAQEITTQLTEATNVDVMNSHGTGRNAAEQPTGDNWMTGEFIRTFRDGNAGPRMSAIDCGGHEGTVVYAPVSGTVVLVKDYKLYDEYDDIRIHIQPEGRQDLDVVLIHLTDPQVKAGDQVIAGQTKLAKIRDVYAYIGEEMQLKQYTAEGDNGNHTHIAVNDVNDPKYHALDDLKKEQKKDDASSDAKKDS